MRDHLLTGIIRRSFTGSTATTGRHRRITVRRRVIGGLAMGALIATPVTVVQLERVAANASGPDTIQFTQTSGSSKSYIQYVPGDSTQPTTTQSVTGGGGCANPTVGPAITGKTQGSTAPILGWGAGVWNSNDYSGTRGQAVVAAYNGATGVCALSQAYSIDNVARPSSGNSAWGVEALDFSSGTNPVDAGRPFTRAQIKLANNSSTATSVTLVETLSGSPVGTQSCTLGGTAKSNSPTIVLADTKAPSGSACTGNDPSLTGFDTVEVQVPNTPESVSVVQTSTFTLGGGKICGGQTISTSSTDGSATSGDISASLTLNAPSSDCKTYSNFAATANAPADPNAPNTSKEIVFSGTGQSLQGTDHITTIVDWGYEPTCDASGNATDQNVCAPTLISFDGGAHWVPQTFCSAAGPDTPQWCTTKKTFNYTDRPGSVHITETWDGIGDPYIRTGP